MRKLLFGLAAVAGLSAGASFASTITYNVNQVIGAGSVTGTITTNGAAGVLSSANIMDWSLNLVGNGASTMLGTSGSGVIVVGSDLTASPTALTFDFSGTDGGYLLFQATYSSGQRYFCESAGASVCVSGASVVPGSYTDASAQFDSVLSGTQTIATVNLSTVPLPGAFVLLASVVGIAEFTRRRCALPCPDRRA